MTDKNDALKRWLGKAWNLRGQVERIAYAVDHGTPVTQAMNEIDRLFGRTGEQDMGKRLGLSVGVDSLLPRAPRADIQPKPRRSGAT